MRSSDDAAVAGELQTDPTAGPASAPSPPGTASFAWLAGRASSVAGRLLGVTLVCGRRAGTIVEVEAYEGADDPASHAFGGRSARNAVMFGRAGVLYVYRSYGVHWCANVVCGPEGVASAVLIRAIEPSRGEGEMWHDRPRARRSVDLGSGPGKLCAALGIGGEHNATDLLDPSSPVRLIAPLSPAGGDGAGPGIDVVTGPRVGISRATERPWRFAVRGNPHVSRPRL